MSDHRMSHSPSRSGRGYLSDDDYAPRDKFRRERSPDRDYMDDYHTDEYGRFDRRKRHRRSPSPPEDRRRKYRRASPSPPPHHYRYGRHGKDAMDGDRYMPKYDRERDRDRDSYGQGSRYDGGGRRRYDNYQQRKHNAPQRFFYDNPMMATNTWSMPSRQVPLMVDPMQLDYIVPFRQFSDYVRQKSGKQVSDDEVQRQFDEYKEKVSAKQLDAFFNNNKDKQWFLEKYHPEHAQGRINTVYEQRRIALERFRAALPDLDHEAIQLDYDANPDKDDHMHLYQQQQLIIKAVPPTIAREKIEEMCRQVAGFDYLALSDPSPSKKFQRIGWIHFSNDTDLQSAFDQLDNQKIDDFTFHLALHRNPPPSASSSAPSSSNTRMKKTAPEIANNPDRVATDLDQATALAHVMDAHLGIDDQQGIDAVLANAPSSNDDDTKKTLDLILLYLRRVHMYCYYCGLECDSFEELHRRCPEPHLRKQPLHADQPLPSKTERALQQWAKNLDQRIRIKLQPPDDEDLVRMGGKSVKAELDKYMAEHIQKEHDAKYKCKVGECAKAFKGVEFVEKHIHSKHPEVIKQMKNELAFYNNYVCDPNHLLPMQPPQNDRNAASSSSSSMASSMASSAAAAHVASMPAMNTDQIPRIGFSSGPWATPPMPRIPSGKSMDMLMDMPQDPRQVKSYVDLDAPADGDSTILFY